MNFEQQIAYNFWANKRILEAIGASKETVKDEELLKHFGHILHAQIIWYNRVLKINEKVDVWPNLTFEECEKKLSGKESIDLNNMAEKAGQICSYTNTKGMSFESNVSEIVQHVIIHSQHHRAQISLLLRQKGLTPPATDFIVFTR
jgi:uncharacterized damage-inducible protein DinB